jgi:ribosomal-protein-alanine N-acetyltransferase
MSAVDTTSSKSGGARGELVLEPMRSEHVEQVVAIERTIFDSPWTRGMFRQEVADRYLSRSWVAILEGRVIGYLITWFLRDEVHLLNIGIHPDCQGRGYGRRMLDYLISQAVQSDRDSITLEVRSSNRVARRLYESFGFVAVGRRKGYYQDNREDAVVMLLDLRNQRHGENA